MKKRLFGLLALTSLIAFGGGLALKNKEHTPIYAEGEEVSEPASSEEEPISSEEEPISSEEPVLSEEETEPVEEPKETIDEKILKFKDTYLVPLLSGVSLTSILGAVFTISLSLINRKTNKKISLANAITQEQIAKALATVNEQTLKMEVYVNQVMSLVRSIVDEAGEYKQLADETKEMLKAQVDELINETKELADNTEKLFEIKTCMILLIQVQAELAKGNPQAVSSGVTKQLAKLNEQAQKLL